MANAPTRVDNQCSLGRRHKRPRFVWPRDQRRKGRPGLLDLDRWKDILTGKGPDMFIENGLKSNTGKSCPLPWAGWRDLERDHRPWDRQKRLDIGWFDLSGPHDRMHYDFSRRKYVRVPEPDALSKTWNLDHLHRGRIARNFTGDLLDLSGGTLTPNQQLEFAINHVNRFRDYLLRHPGPLEPEQQLGILLLQATRVINL